MKNTMDTSKTFVENKSNDDRSDSTEIRFEIIIRSIFSLCFFPISESQSSDDNKKRKVLSLAQYRESKKHVLSPSSTINLTESKLTDIQIKIINAQFKAATEKLTANALDLDKILDMNVKEKTQVNHNRIGFVNRKPVIQQQKSNFYDLWTEDDDDDEDETQIQLSITRSRTENSSSHVQTPKVR